jgi:hypothetical protein
VILEDLAPEERHGIYKRTLSLFRPDRPLEIQASSEVADQAEKDLSYCKLS